MLWILNVFCLFFSFDIFWMVKQEKRWRRKKAASWQCVNRRQKDDDNGFVRRLACKWSIRQRVADGAQSRLKAKKGRKSFTFFGSQRQTFHQLCFLSSERIDVVVVEIFLTRLIFKGWMGKKYWVNSFFLLSIKRFWSYTILCFICVFLWPVKCYWKVSRQSLAERQYNKLLQSILLVDFWLLLALSNWIQ